MAGIVSVSRKNLAQRRKKLRRQQKIKIIQIIWRTLAASSLVAGLLWVTVQPIWVLKTPAQIVIKSDNELLSEQTIQSLLAISYPQSLWRIEPSVIAKNLEAQPVIAQATVSRRLFPPGLMIEIQERVPVAMTHIPTVQRTTSCNNQPQSFPNSDQQAEFSCLQNNSAGIKQDNVSLLDANGVLIPLAKYTALNPSSKLPTLKVIGSPEQYRPYWTQLYQALTQSSLKVMEINCQDPNNLILKTELGNVHLGLPTAQLPEKIELLVQMGNLPKFKDRQLGFIDIKNPEYPSVQMNQK